MSKLSEAFKKRKALIIYITAGDPSIRATENLIYDFERAGADIIELGIPFSDPLADGPVIQESHLRGLKTSLADVFALVKKVRKRTQIPLVFMLAYNLVVQHGEEKFYSDCEKFEVDGVIAPDISPEEAKVKTIYLITPTTKEERIKQIAEASSGFIYLVSVLGVTGKRAKLSDEVAGLVARVKKYTDKPVAVGFGISTPAHAKEAAKYADGVIVGSAVVDLIGRKKYKQAIRLVSQMRKELDAK